MKNVNKKIIFLLSFIMLLCIFGIIFGKSINAKQVNNKKIIYVSQKRNKKSTGSKKYPFVSLQKAIDKADAGTVIYIREGNYKGPFIFHKSGNKKRGYITIAAYKNEKVNISNKDNISAAVFDMGGQSYIKIQKLHIGNIKAENVCGILMKNSESSIVIEKCEFRNIITTRPGSIEKPGGEANAVLLLGEKKKSIHHVYILGNKVHDNINGWSENISVAGNCTNIYVQNNKVYNNTNIGIDFYGNAGYCDDLTMDQPRNCKCIDNTVYNCKSSFAENAGIYIDGAKDILVKGNKTFKNHYGIEVGSEEWKSYYTKENYVRDIEISENIMYNNLYCGLRIGGWSNDKTTGTVYDCKVINNDFSKGNKKDEIILAKCDGILFKDNRFKNNSKCPENVKYDDGISRNKIKNIVFK